MTLTARRSSAVAAVALVMCAACGGGGGGGGPTPDVTPPVVASVEPPDGATGIARGAPVAITFDEAIDVGTVTPATVVFREAAGASVAYHATFSAATRVLTLAPAAALASYREHEVELTAGVADLAGNHPTAARTFRFTTADDVPPAAPGTPADAGAYSGATVQFAWTPATDAGSGVAGYVLQVSGSATGTPILFEGEVGDVLAYGFSAADGQTLYARVAAVDASSNRGAWSGFSDGVVVDALGPAVAPPSDAGDFDDASMHFAWEAAADSGSGVAGYVLQIASLPDAATVLQERDTTGLGADFDASPYGDGATFHARLGALDAVGNLAWSTWTDGVTLDAAAPTVPGPPVDGGACSRERALHFAWAPSTDAGSGVASYTIEVATSPAGVPLHAATVTSTSLDYEYTGAIPETIVARVSATDQIGNASAFSTPSDGIVVREDVPAAPAAPVDAGAYTSGPTVAFTWSPPSTGVPDEYVLEVGTSPDAADLVAGGTLPGTTATAEVDVSRLPTGTTCYARVAARTGGIAGAFSPSSDGITVDTTAPGAPGTPADRGDWDDRWVTFTWTAAPDPESGIASYEVEVYDGPVAAGSAVVAERTYSFDALGRVGPITARVRAQNGAGLLGPFSAASDGIALDLDGPGAAMPLAGQTGVATHADLRIDFTEAMDPASVESAFALAWGEAHPRNGYAFRWSADDTSVVVVPDTQDPAGVTNVDLLPEATAIRVTLSAGATDRVGNALVTPLDATFTTADETPPRLVSLTVDGHPSPVPPASVKGGFALVATFDEDMDPRPPWVEVRLGQVSIPGAGAWTGPRTLEFTADATVSLPAGADLDVHVRAADAAGSAASLRSFLQVAQDPARDAERPRLVSVFPASPVRGTQPLGLRFTEPLDRSSLAGVTATAAGGDVYEVTYDAGEYGPVIAFLPRRSPPAGSAVSLHVPATVRDLAGNTLAAPLDVTFTVAAFTDAAPPVAGDTLPAAGQPEGGREALEIGFVDASTGHADALDALSVGPEDVLVVDDESGLPVRGWRPSVRPGSSTLSLAAPPRGVGLWPRWRELEVLAAHARAATGLAEYTTAAPHGLAVGARVDVQMRSPADAAFDRSEAAVVAVPSADAFALAWSGPDADALDGGSSGWVAPVSVTVRYALGPAGGGTGIADASGNAAAEGAFTATASPWPNRAPHAAALEGIRVGATTGPRGRRLDVRLEVEDADADPVTVSVTGRDGAIAFDELTRTLQTDAWAEYVYGDEGGPAGPPRPANLNDVSFPSSGWYPFTVTLSDGTATTSHRRVAWVWAPADVPALVSIDDGGTVRAVREDRPLVLENAASPTFRWAGADAQNADFLFAWVIETGAIDGGDYGYDEVIPLPPATTEVAAPRPLVPSVYLWTVAQVKRPGGWGDAASAGWSLDLLKPSEAMFVYAPLNRALAGQHFGVATVRLERARAAGTVTAVESERGLYGIELGAEGPPITVTYDLLDNAGRSVTGADRMFVNGTGGTFVVSEPPALLTFPLLSHGFVRAAHDLFVVAQRTHARPSICAGARRLATGGFPAALPGRFSFVQVELDGGPALASIGGAVGELEEASPGLLAMRGTSTTGDPLVPFTAPYSIDDAGLLRIDVGATPGAELASGFLGGAAGAEIVAVASDSTPDRVFWLLAGRAYGWSGAETVADLAGAYRFVTFAVRREDGALVESHAANGSLVFDGLGSVTYEVETNGAPLLGTGAYAVDPAAGRVSVTVERETFLLAAGPDLGLLYGVTTSSDDGVAVLVLGR